MSPRDLDIAPDPEFVRILQAVLRADMGWEPDAVPILRVAVATGRSRHVKLRIAEGIIAAAAVLALVFVLIGRGHQPPSGPPATTSTSTTAPSTTAPGTTSVETVTAALPNFDTLASGTTYRVGRSSIGHAVQLTNAVDGVHAFNGRGGFVVTNDQLGTELLVGMFDLGTVSVFDDPLVDGSEFLRGTKGGLLPDVLEGLTSPAPADILAYLSALPGMEMSTPVETEFAGHPATKVTWKVGAFAGGHPCFESDRGTCVLVFSTSSLGWLTSYWTGDSGTTYVIDLDGQKVLVEVQDRPGASEIADSIVISD